MNELHPLLIRRTTQGPHLIVGSVMNLPDNVQCYKMASIHHGHVLFIKLATGADYYAIL